MYLTLVHSGYDTPLFLSDDITHFYYHGERYQLKHWKTFYGKAVTESIGGLGRRNPVQIGLKEYIYRASGTTGKKRKVYEFRIVTVTDSNTYFSNNRYTFAYAVFNKTKFKFKIN